MSEHISNPKTLTPNTSQEVVSAEHKHRTLNVEVPEEVYWHIRRCATESRLPVKEYMAKFCEGAKPFPPQVPGPTCQSQLNPEPE